ncbi:MAG: ABC transporter permease [Myxococcales bacterium]|nr:ABC transporter permease [Myxococcales bacterium]
MKISTLAAMAWRNIWRNRRRTLVTLASIVFGTFLAIMLTGVGDATYGSMIDTAARMGNGHVTVQHPMQVQAPAPKRFISGTTALADKIKADPEVKHVSARIMGQVMLAAAGESRGAGVIGIDPTVESKDTLSALGGISEGKLFGPDDKRGIVLGADLARHLGVKLGRKVVFTLTDRHGEVFSGLARVRGLIHTGTSAIDGGLCLLPISVLRKALGYGPDDATLLAVLVTDQRYAAAVSKRLMPLANEQRVVLTWHQTLAEMSGFIDMKLSGAAFMQGLMMLLIAAGIFNALFVSVMERLPEFGILTAIGWRRSQLFILVMLESLWLALVGIGLSAVVTALPYYKLSTDGFSIADQLGDGAEIANVMMDPTMYVRIHPENLALIVLAVVTATLLSGLFPAYKAGSVNPVDAIKLV